MVTRINDDELRAHGHTFHWGVSLRGAFQPNPPLHVVHREGNEWKTWCGGGGAHEGMRNVTGRKCPRCMALLRADFVEYS
jgi:hypothetical protein